MLYTNWRKEQAWRLILPIKMWFGQSEYHLDGPQWFVRAFDIEKQEMRDFALTGVAQWG